mgnify:CR=1 FL=1
MQQQKGGEDETGPYDVVENWPQPWSKPGYIWGSQPGVFAESPNRIFIAARGELKLPNPLPRGFTNEWGSLGERATVPPAEMRNCLLVVDGQGNAVAVTYTLNGGYGNGSTVSSNTDSSCLSARIRCPRGATRRSRAARLPP